MESNQMKKIVTTVMMIALLQVSGSVYADINDNIERWQKSVLFQPSLAQIRRELSGSIMIYDGLSDRVVEEALDSQFDRINAMMFTRVTVTDDNGDDLIDPETGEVVAEEDGCD